jgi:hypothetical protein
VVPDLVNVLNDDEGLTDRFPIVDENRDLLVNRVHLETFSDLKIKPTNQKNFKIPNPATTKKKSKA